MPHAMRYVFVVDETKRIEFLINKQKNKEKFRNRQIDWWLLSVKQIDFHHFYFNSDAPFDVIARTFTE